MFDPLFFTGTEQKMVSSQPLSPEVPSPCFKTLDRVSSIYQQKLEPVQLTV